ncbi:PREDICTED: PHD finger protein 20 isoform X2 [Gekko japonicus]|uniref:PHD finger protein 20 isoform X2 n=1 Tax=Gekko japonicus TaxID=146911 RepID=A0ABM1JQH5_GEKJA|nr:PREDICTED: PHD finger protein 20 isoform X2 [Gekko japonicus]
MRKHPPNRRGISFEVGAQLEARDRLKNWYPAHIEEIDYEEGKVLIHFKRWNHRYDEWFCWDSPYLRPLEKIQLRKEGLHEEEVSSGFHTNDQVLACWSDCRFYPAKVTSVNKDGTYTVKFYDGVVQTVKNIHVKAFSKDQSVVNNPRPKERGNEIPSSPERWEKFKEQRKTAENKKKDKDEKVLKIERRSKPDKEGKLIVASEKGKVSEKALQKDGKEDKENISENDREFSIDTQIEKKPENDSVKTPPENLKVTKRRRGRPPVVPPAEQGSQTLQPITLELRRRKIPKGGDVPSKRPRLQKNMSQEKLKNSPDSEKDSIKRRSRHSTSSNQEALDTDIIIAQLDEIEVLKDAEPSPKETSEGPSETCLECDQKISEQLPPPSEVSQTLVDESRLKEENIKESSSIPESQESSEASVTVTSVSKKTDDSAVSKAAVDHEPKFRCKFLDCSKSFRKAKLLHYHMKYFHGIEKPPEPQQSPATRNIQTRSLASEKANQEGSNRRRTTSAAKEKEKNKEKKPRDIVRSKSKKKKKKKKKPKSENSGSEENVEFSQGLSPPRSVTTARYNSANRSSAHLTTQLHGSDTGHRKHKSKITEDDTLSESSTDSLLWSDDDCSQDVDVTTNPDDDLEDDDNDFEIVRCICEVEEENDFMIQCEECLCWQHGVCMGLLEDNVPEKYTCYICQDPPGTKISKVAESSNSKRSSLKYWYEKEWLCSGHMHGLAFLGENYSHQNAKKIVATHQLLGDVQKVIEVLHGLQLKMSILQSKEHPDLKLWCQPWKHLEADEKSPSTRLVHIEENCCNEETTSYRTLNGTIEKPSAIPSIEESYITSEHCYQKPRAYYPAIEQRLVVETRNSDIDDGVNRIRENGDDTIVERLGWELDKGICKLENESKHNYSKVRENMSKKVTSDEAIEVKLLEKDKEGVVNSQLQWQLNLLAHVESLQDEVTHRMDLIEKELDVLESWLDYTGELEPPEPLARLPQLKHCIKQLLTDLGKVQQIALCCST